MVVAATLADIRNDLDQIAGRWRSETPAEQRADLTELDDLLSSLDEVETDHSAALDAVEELRGRIEILMDEIEISLGLEPAALDDLPVPDEDPGL